MRLWTGGLLFVLATALAGCWRDPSPPAPTVQRASAVVSSPCPFALAAEVLWAHELFPACSPPPFLTQGIACVGACPMPCSETSHGSTSDSGWRYTFTWTDGRLATSEGVSTGGLLDNTGKVQTRHEQCEYDHGRVTRCDALDGHVEVHRDARGQIIEVVVGDNPLAVTYDSVGDVVELAGSNGYTHARFRYDDAHRLVAEEQVRRDGTVKLLSRYVYDARGRYVHADLGLLKLRYDETTGLLVETVGQVDAGHGLATETVNIKYDDRARPIRILSVAMPDGVAPERAEDFGLIVRDEHEYVYDCPR